MKTYRELLESSKGKKPSKKDLEKAKKQAARWSLDNKNNIGQALITFLGGRYTISSDASPGVFVIAKFIDGKEVQIPDNKLS